MPPSAMPFRKSQKHRGEISWPQSRSLKDLPRVHLHFKDNLSFLLKKTPSQRWVGIIATVLEFSASLSSIYPPGKSEIIEDVQYFASSCEVNQNRGNVFP